MLSNAPVAFRCTRISFDRASRVRGTKAPDFAIFVLLSSRGRRQERKSGESLDIMVTMGSQICNATNSVTLDFNIGTKHLTNQWLEATQFDNEKLVISYNRQIGGSA